MHAKRCLSSALILIVVACAELPPQDDGLGPIETAGRGGSTTIFGLGGSASAASAGDAGESGQSEDGGLAHAGNGFGGGSGSDGRAPTGTAGTSGTAGSAGDGAGTTHEGVCGADDSRAGEGGGACPAQRDPECVTDCSSLERTPAVLDQDGSWRCPAEAPLRAEECHIDCPALYHAADDIEKAYVCGAGTFCTPRGLYSYLDACTAPATRDVELDGGCRCLLVPQECPDDSALSRPTCGADGNSYANECEMWRARMGYPGEEAGCANDQPGYFACEHTYCLDGVEICVGPTVVDDHHVTGGTCIESACAASGGCECLVAELGAASDSSFDEDSPGPVPEGYTWCSDGSAGRVFLKQ